jgi:hypothetical protein
MAWLSTFVVVSPEAPSSAVTKMNMVWVAVASLLYPRVNGSALVSKQEIDAKVLELFGQSITPVMITKHLVSSEPRQADYSDPNRGGSRNRYLVRDVDGYRLHKRSDIARDAPDKIGPTHPSPDAVEDGYRHLIAWYESEYVHS